MNRSPFALRSPFLGLCLVLFVAACGGGDVEDLNVGAPPETSSTDETLPEETLPEDTLPEDTLPEGTLPEGPLGAGVLATINVVITHPEADDVSYTVTCLGDTATLVGDVEINEQQACSKLGEPAVRARLLDGVPADQICTEQYGGPDVATITGTYDGVDGPAINTTVDRSNGCGIADWDAVLAGVLPPALGL